MINDFPSDFLWFILVIAYSIESGRNVFYKHISSQSDYCLYLSSKQFCNCQCTPNSYNSRYHTTICIAIYEFRTMIKPPTKYNIHRAELIEKIAIIVFFLNDSGTNYYRKIKFSVIKRRKLHHHLILMPQPNTLETW